MAEITITERLPFPLAKPNEETFVTQASEIGHGKIPVAEEIEQLQQDGQAVSAQAAETQVELNQFKGDVKDTYGYYQDNEEYLDVTTDSESHLLELTKSDGTKVFFGNVDAPNIREDEEHIAAIQGKTDTMSTRDSLEYLDMTLDENGKIIEGINRDGKVISNLSTDEIKTKKITASSINTETGISITDIAEEYKQPTIDAMSETSFATKYNSVMAASKDEVHSPDVTPSVVININSQNDFDTIDVAISNAISSIISDDKEKIIEVAFHGNLKFDENHIDLSLSNFANSSGFTIIITGGNDCSITSNGNIYSKDAQSVELSGRFYKLPYQGTYSYKFMYFCDGVELQNARSIQYAKEKLDIVEEISSTNLYCRIKLADEDLCVTTATHIRVTSWYSSYVYEVEKIEDGYVYFYSNTMDYAGSINLNRVNGDDIFCGAICRYILINTSEDDVHVHDGYLYFDRRFSQINECSNQTFLRVNDGFANVILRGLSFVGNADKGVQDYYCARVNDALLEITSGNTTKLFVEYCDFKHIRSAICGMSNAQYLYVYRCKTSDCYRCFVTADYATNHIQVLDCECTNMVRNITYEGVISIEGADFLIKNNRIINFPYSSVWSGVEGNNILQYASEGIIEGNDIGWEQGYAAESWKHSLMDCGAIYIYCRTNGIIIRDNFIYGYKGIYNDRAIMIDGYANNISIVGNIALCASRHSIHLYRKSPTTVTDAERAYSSTNNFICYNVVASRYYFWGYDNCIKGMNYLLSPYGKHNSSVKKDNSILVSQFEDDYVIYDTSLYWELIRIPTRYYDSLENIKISDRLKSRIITNKY